MGNSWGHSVRRLTEAEAALYARQDRGCASGKCREAATHMTEYSYVTGRAGRTSWSARRACAKHAEAFAAKHEVEIGDGPPTEHASQAALRQAFGTED